MWDNQVYILKPLVSTKAGLLVWFGLILLLCCQTSFQVKETALLIHQSGCSPSMDYVCMCMLTTKKCFNQSINQYLLTGATEIINYKTASPHKTIPVAAFQTLAELCIPHTLTVSPEDFYPSPADLANPFSYSAGNAPKSPRNPP